MYKLEKDTSIFICNKIFLGISDDPNKFINGGILVNSNGKIIKIVTDSNALKQIVSSNRAKIFNFTDKTLMPGLIDSHVHVNEPGRTDWEGFATATKAAAAGGFTTIVDMPLNSIPATTTVANLKTKINCAKDQIYVDVAFWGGFIPDNINDIPDMINYGVVGFKCFMCPSGVPEFPHVAKDDIEKVIPSIENGNSVLAFHAEIDSSCCLPEKEQTFYGDPVKFETYLKSRPSSFETSAVKIVLDFAKENPKCKMHIVHLSTSDSLDIIRPVRAKCPNLTIETCYHYLSLDCNQVADGHTEFKCCPPIRDVENRDKLWEAIKNKEINLIVSDHSPSTADMKLLGPTSKNNGDFLKAWGGISSNQYGLSLFWTHCKKYGLGINNMHELMCVRPAKLCGLDNRKGSIQVGLDADFCVWDPNEEFIVKQEDIQFKNKMTPYLNMNLQGVVHATIVRGIVVYKKTEQFGKPTGNILLNPKIAETVL